MNLLIFNLDAVQINPVLNIFKKRCENFIKVPDFYADIL